MKTIKALVLIAFFITIINPCFGMDVQTKISSSSGSVVSLLEQKVSGFNTKNYAIVPAGINTPDDRKLLQKMIDDLFPKLVSMKLNVISGKGLLKALEKIDFSISGTPDDTEIIEAGEMLGVDIMFILRIYTDDKNTSVSINAFDVETSQLLFNVTTTFFGAKSAKDVFRFPRWSVWLTMNYFVSFNENSLATNDLNGEWVEYDYSSSGTYEYLFYDNSGGFYLDLNTSYALTEVFSIFLGIGFLYTPTLALEYDTLDEYYTIDVPEEPFPYFMVNNLRIGGMARIRIADFFNINTLASVHCALLETTEDAVPVVSHGLVFYPGMSVALEPEFLFGDLFSIFINGEYTFYFITKHDFIIATVDQFLHGINTGIGIRFRF